MKKLKNKVFFTIFSILTISLLSFVFIYNTENYIEQKRSIQNSLEIASNNKRKDTKIPPNQPIDDSPKKDDNTDKKEDEKEKNIDKNIKFMDKTIYTILLDENDNIKDIINRSSNERSNSEIKSLAIQLLKKKNLKQEDIGFLYVNDYSYQYLKGESLTIIDNTKIKKSLLLFLGRSLFGFILLEMIIIFLSKKITNWIIKPVEESFKRQKQFIADASHELKTPLSVIMASSDALTESPSELKWLKNIQTESERMNNLITDLLELSHSEGKNKQKFKIGNLSKVVELSILTFEGRAYEKKIKLESKIDENISFLMDENGIKQLIEILLDNAIEHSLEKQTIHVFLKDKNNHIELLVENIGDEIPKGEEEKIFERFYRVDKARNRNKNRYGLGLAIAKNIALNHQGKISASSSQGVTTFKVLFKK